MDLPQYGQLSSRWALLQCRFGQWITSAHGLRKTISVVYVVTMATFPFFCAHSYASCGLARHLRMARSSPPLAHSPYGWISKSNTSLTFGVHRPVTFSFRTFSIGLALSLAFGAFGAVPYLCTFADSVWNVNLSTLRPPATIRNFIGARVTFRPFRPTTVVLDADAFGGGEVVQDYEPTTARRNEAACSRPCHYCLGRSGKVGVSLAEYPGLSASHFQRLKRFLFSSVHVYCKPGN